MKNPSVNDLQLAAKWLDVYEGDVSPEAEAYRRVAKWLAEQAEAAEAKD